MSYLLLAPNVLEKKGFDGQLHLRTTSSGRSNGPIKRLNSPGKTSSGSIEITFFLSRKTIIIIKKVYETSLHAFDSVTNTVIYKMIL